MRFKIDWASLIVGRKFAVFALFYIVFEGNFQVQVPGGGLYLEGQFNRGFFALRVWGAYIWRGLFKEFYGISNKYILTIIMYLFIYFSWLIYDWNLNRTKDSLEVQMLQQHNLFYYGVLTPSRLTSRQPREEFQCLYENLMSDGFRKTAVLKKILFSLLE